MGIGIRKGGSLKRIVSSQLNTSKDTIDPRIDELIRNLRSIPNQMDRLKSYSNVQAQPPPRNSIGYR